MTDPDTGWTWADATRMAQQVVEEAERRRAEAVANDPDSRPCCNHDCGANDD